MSDATTRTDIRIDLQGVGEAHWEEDPPLLGPFDLTTLRVRDGRSATIEASCEASCLSRCGGCMPSASPDGGLDGTSCGSWPTSACGPRL